MLIRLSAVALLAGVVFIVGAVLPISSRVFPERSSDRKLEHILASTTQWTVANVLFGVGAAVVAGGIVLFALFVDDLGARTLALVSGVLALAGLVPWIVHLSARVADPAAFARGDLPSWWLWTYFILTPLAIALFGAALLASGLLAAWVGWTVIGTMAVTIVATLIAGDMVPAVYYLVTLLPGTMLLIAATRA